MDLFFVFFNSLLTGHVLLLLPLPINSHKAVKIDISKRKKIIFYLPLCSDPFDNDASCQSSKKKKMAHKVF